MPFPPYRQLITPIANGSEQRNQIPNFQREVNTDFNASVEDGFPGRTMIPRIQGGLAPVGPDFNGLFHIATSTDFFLQRGAPGCVFSDMIVQYYSGYPKRATLMFDDDTVPYLAVSMRENNVTNFNQYPDSIGRDWARVPMFDTYVPGFVYPVGFTLSGGGMRYIAILQNGPGTPSGEVFPGANDAVWQPVGAGLTTIGGIVPGWIQFMPHRPTSLPLGWYPCTGDTFPLTTAVGQVLNNFHPLFKQDWGIVTANGMINLPDKWQINNHPTFMCSVDGTSRLPGSTQDWFWPQISAGASSSSSTSITATGSALGTFTAATRGIGATATGAFSIQESGTRGSSAGYENSMAYAIYQLSSGGLVGALRATTTTSTSVSISQPGTKNSYLAPANLGMTLAIFLGV